MSFKVLFSLMICLSLPTACILRSGVDFGGGGIILSPSRTDSRSIRTSSSSRSSRRNETGICEDVKGCANLCYKIYDPDGTREATARLCEKLPASIVYDFTDIEDALEDPDDYPLDAIKERSFEKFLELSKRPWIDTVRRANGQDHKERIFIWIAENPKIADILVEAQDNRESGVGTYVGISEILDCRFNAEIFYQTACDLGSENKASAEALLTGMGCTLLDTSRCTLKETEDRRIAELEQQNRERDEGIKKGIEREVDDYVDKVKTCFSEKADDCYIDGIDCFTKCARDRDLEYTCPSGYTCSSTKIEQPESFRFICREFDFYEFRKIVEIGVQEVKRHYSTSSSQARCDFGTYSNEGNGVTGGTQKRSEWERFR